MHEPKQPLAEVFGFLTSDLSPQATRYRTNRLCPFNNKVPNCTKDKAAHPLGVCSIYNADEPVITCPIRFREDWQVADDAAAFFFPSGTTWTSLIDVRLNDGYDKHVATIDVVLVAYDEKGKVFDFGALGIQAVYTTGNARAFFDSYMQSPTDYAEMGWLSGPDYPQPDYLWSWQTILAPRFSGMAGIFKGWQKRTAVAINKAFFTRMPSMPTVEKAEADIAWLVYDLQLHNEGGAPRYRLTKVDEVYTRFALPHWCTTVAMPDDISRLMRALNAELYLQGDNFQ